LLLAVVFWGPPALVAADSEAALGGLTPVEQQWRFRVLLDGREIGFHDFRVSQGENEQRVEIEARFDVRFLFVNAYRYRHQNVETWRGGCLSGIASSTDDNGELLRVSGAPVGAGFGISRQTDARIVEAECVRSFAYWDFERLTANRLLNAQTGELVDVRVEDRGAETVELADSAVAARRYTLIMPEGTIDLWYARETGQWLALESRTAGGRLLRYEPVRLPLPLDGAKRLAMQ
jgi:hypothetical protein